MEHILSLSYGKDSMACLGAIELLGWPLDRIVTADVWATDTIPADLPPMVEFKTRADETIKRRWGITVEHVRATHSYEHYFYKQRGTGKHTGQIHGFPMTRGAWCNDRLKTNPMDRYKESVCISYIGIAADEPQRFGNLSDTKRSPLVEAGWTEAMCREWCEKNGLLSPIYTTATRGGLLVLPQSGRRPAAAIATELPGVLGADAQMGQGQSRDIPPGRAYRPRL